MELQTIMKAFSDKYALSHKILPHQKKAVEAIKSCRTKRLGGHKDVCDSCGIIKISYNSCGNRNCPKCGNMAKEQWILDRMNEVLPVTYFHTVFTIPHELNPLFFNNQELLYKLLFKAASETLLVLARDKKFLGAKVGITMVLHTWGQSLSYHPHVHCIVPGGGLSSSELSFVKSKEKFFIPVRIMSRVFRGKLLAFINKEQQNLCFTGCAAPYAEKQTFKQLIDSLYKKNWVVYCKKPFKNTGSMVKYLSRYTHKTAIYNNRLESITQNEVSFRYRDYRNKNQSKVMTLKGEEFLRRFLMHVLPKGFQKIRHYGLLGNRHRKQNLTKCFRLLKKPMPEKTKYSAQELMLKVLGKDITICPFCGGRWLRYTSFLPDSG